MNLFSVVIIPCSIKHSLGESKPLKMSRSSKLSFLFHTCWHITLIKVKATHKNITWVNPADI